jgi:hypothetical protein
MRQQPGPPYLMKVIYCNCNSERACSSQMCTCRKNNLKCIEACGHCHGKDCSNVEVVVVADDNESENESKCGDNTEKLPDVLWDADLEWVDKEEVVDLGSDYIFDPAQHFNISDIADEEILNLSQ